jgi:hypothetical protein
LGAIMVSLWGAGSGFHFHPITKKHRTKKRSREAPCIGTSSGNTGPRASFGCREEDQWESYLQQKNSATSGCAVA